MSEISKIIKAKYNALIQALEEFGYKSSNRVGQKEIRLFLDKKSSSGQFDSLLCNKLFQVLNISEKSEIPLNQFAQGFLIFENEVIRNAESFRIKLAKEEEIYNKLLKQCELYKSEKLNEEGFCNNAKIYGQITDIDIKQKLKGIKEIIIEVIFNNKKEELHFKIGGHATNMKKSFEFRPTSRKDHFEFVMKGINDQGSEFSIGSKIFPLTDISSQEEYIVQIIVPEIGNSNKVAAYINATIVLYMSDFQHYDNLRKKQEKRLKKFQNAANKSVEYLKYVREIYGNIKLMSHDIVVDYNNEKLMERKGAKLDINVNTVVEGGTQRGNYFVEYNNERERQKIGEPLKIEFNNLKPITNPVVETKKIEYNYKTNYNNIIQKNIIQNTQQQNQQNTQVIQKIEKENVNSKNNTEHKIPEKKDIKIENQFNHMKLFSDLDKEDIPQDLNKINVNTNNQQIYAKEQKITEPPKSARQLETQSDLEKNLPNQNSGVKEIKTVQQTKTETLQSISTSPKYTQKIQPMEKKFDLDAYIYQKYKINGSQRLIQQQKQITQNINTNIGLNNQQNLSQVQQNKFQGNN